MQSMRKLLNHRLFLSVALTETGSVHSLRLRSVWLAAACVFALSGWLGMVVAGDLAGARLKAKLTGNAELQYYIDQIAELRNQRDAERVQVKMIAQEMGVLQARLDRFDALSSKLQAEGTLISSAPGASGEDDTAFDEGGTKVESTEGGQGGPYLQSSTLTPSLAEIRQQMGMMTGKADLAELALETSLAMAIRKAVGGGSGGGIPYLWPLMSDGYRLSSPFGWRSDPIRGRRAWHAGMDMADKTGSPVIAAADGTVVYSGWRLGYGNLVEIKHSNGFTTRYGHLYRTIAREGDVVEAGQLVALLGNTGRSTGAHLHFEVRKDGNALNPMPFIKDTRSEVLQSAKAGRGKELLAKWRTTPAARR